MNIQRKVQRNGGRPPACPEALEGLPHIPEPFAYNMATKNCTSLISPVSLSAIESVFPA